MADQIDRDRARSKAPTGRRGKPVPKVTPEALAKAAARYLERYATSVAHLRRILERRVARAARAEDIDVATAHEAIGGILAKLVDAGFLDDAAYAAARARSLHRRGASARAIQARLTQMGVDPELIGPAVAARSEDPGDPELLAALTFARRRRLGPYRPSAERPARRDRDLAALGRQGFGFNVAQKVIDASDRAALEAEVEASGV